MAPADIHLWSFFLWFLSSCFFGNNQSVLTCRLLWALRVVSDIRRYDWGFVTYDFFITFLRRAYKYVPALRPWYMGLSATVYPRAYVWALCAITRVVIVQLVTISAALYCVTWDEMIVRPYDGSLLGRPKLTIAMGQLRI